MTFKRLKDKVAIVGFNQETLNLAPFDDPSYEIWGCNEGYANTGMKRYDRWFQIHPESDYLRVNNQNDFDHPNWLKQLNGTFPIYMQNINPNILGSIAYPLEEITKDIMPDFDEPYFLSTPAYMAGMAIWMGYKVIASYGLRMDEGYRYQRANYEFILGIARGRGIKLEIPDKSPLCKGLLYGYVALEADYKEESWL